MKYTKKIIVYYNSKMVINWNEINESKSPSKPKYFMRKCAQSDLNEFIEIDKSFMPFSKKDFLLAHTKEYVDAFFAGKKPLCESNGLEWSKEFSETVKYTNASLYLAIKNSVLNPSVLHLSPTSGFHHATPQQGKGFCTFSGQVISALKIYKEFNLSGAFIDLDGHFGNSIEDSRTFCADLNNVIPVEFNINPKHQHKKYINDLALSLTNLEEALLLNKIHYVVYCHGADSHKDDDLGYQLTTLEWFYCTKLICEMLHRVNKKLNKNIPFTYCLFGGYRNDDYNAVIDLHYKDLEYCFELLTS